MAARTERVYDGISGILSEEDFYGYQPGDGWGATRGRAGVQSFALIDRLKRYYGLWHLGRKALLLVRDCRLSPLDVSRDVGATSQDRHRQGLAEKVSDRRLEPGQRSRRVQPSAKVEQVAELNSQDKDGRFE